MVKELFFTTHHNPQKEANKLNTFVSFQYDPKTGKLMFIDSFNGEVKSFLVGTAVAETTEEPATDPETDPQTDPTTDPDDGGIGG